MEIYSHYCGKLLQISFPAWGRKKSRFCCNGMSERHFKPIQDRMVVMGKGWSRRAGLNRQPADYENFFNNYKFNTLGLLQVQHAEECGTLGTPFRTLYAPGGGVGPHDILHHWI
jgi:hypothetical protein